MTKAEMKEMLLQIWESSKGNWTYGGEGADYQKSPAGWVIASDSGVMGKFKDMVDRINEE